MLWTERRRVAALSLLATYLFFIEYVPPFKRVHFPYDIQGFHYPLLHHAFQSIREGRFPEWDPTIYCGLSFVGNLQAALFYPPNWLLFAANLGCRRLSYKSLEILVIAHFWLAFFLCYVWLRGKRLAQLPSALGAGVFAYSGYMVSQAQHVGVVTGYAWIPLGLWGIDQATERRHWRPLWRLATASALCFLAGYPPTWFVFCTCMVVYAVAGPGRRRAAPAVALALAFSLLLVMVQLLPAREAASLKIPELKYGGGIRGGELYISYFLPNYFDPGRPSIGDSDPTREYFYLGAPALFGLAWMLLRRRLRDYIPVLAIAGVSLIAMTNPFGLVEALVDRSSLLTQLCRDWNFLAGLTLAAALLAAVALDDFLKSGFGPATRQSAMAAIALLAVWSLRQLWVWLPGGSEFAAGWRAAFEPAVMLAVFSLGLYQLRAAQGARRAWLAATLLVAVGMDYKVFGTSKLFNADGDDVDKLYSGVLFRGMDDAVFRQLRANPEFRVALEEAGPFPTDLRHFGLTTPQGFDPMLPAQYKKAVEAHTPFRTDRLFNIDPANEPLLRLLAVRYFLTTETGLHRPALRANSSFRLLEPSQGYFQVFEYLPAQPAYRWDGAVERTLWTPEKRGFLVRSGGGRFVLVEQFFPGWRATVDHRPVPIERWGEAFQAIQVEPGEHRIQFEFRSRDLRLGALISMVSLVGLVALVLKK